MHGTRYTSLAGNATPGWVANHAMLKDSSLVSVIGFEELTRRGQLIIAQTYGSFEIWTTVAILYLIMTLAISRVVAALEKR